LIFVFFFTYIAKVEFIMINFTYPTNRSIYRFDIIMRFILGSLPLSQKISIIDTEGGQTSL